ncbi:hypothetical protein DCAR_0206450 [Daucus carota subsp. sativus]|uniref:Uncharacterized protein n=1 Tax=Daucus carota subsp. sativus TaxID=79200 RepID=A0A169WP98_DAUCS|nr:PREDICTED: uncharacterized protein LOC108206876 [Daucus carota subsp. sativus]WOG87227.1 hypothetical protein DCAR_0206450 [Daucus carota subsp. sativus]
MGQGEEVKTRDAPNVEIQERGEIFFFYRPKIDKQEAHSADDVQRMFIVLRPESSEASDTEVKQDPKSGKESASSGQQGGHGEEHVNIKESLLFRLIVMGKKSLPDPGKKNSRRPFWGFVELVTKKLDDIKDALRGQEYDTATKGRRKNSDARAFGEGVYRILKHELGNGKMHTHLIYKLEFPGGDKRNEVQESLNVKREGSFLIQIKNPERKGGAGGGFGGLQKKRKAVFPAHLQGEFGSLGYHAADPPDFLNYEGCELLLIAASDDIEEELGLDLKTETSKSSEDEEEEEECKSCSDLVKTFGEIASTRPLFEGTWV